MAPYFASLCGERPSLFSQSTPELLFHIWGANPTGLQCATECAGRLSGMRTGLCRLVHFQSILLTVIPLMISGLCLPVTQPTSMILS